jgi:hypothetical protein
MNPNTNLHTYMRIYIYAYIHMYMYTYLYTYMYTKIPAEPSITRPIHEKIYVNEYKYKCINV